MFWLTFTFCTSSTPWENESNSMTWTCGLLGDVRGFYLIVLKNGSCKFYYFVDNLQTISLWNCGLWWIIVVYGKVCKTPFSCLMNHKSKYWKDKENSQEQAYELLSSVIYSPCRPLLWLPNVQGVPTCTQSVLQQASAGCHFRQLWLGNIYLERVLGPKADNLVPKTSGFMKCHL